MLTLSIRSGILGALRISKLAIFCACLLTDGNAYAAGQAEYVIQISVDGAGSSYIQYLINEGHLPNFKRFQSEGAWTLNARTDFDYTITLPNHTSMMTGRPVYDKGPIAGHLWVENGEPGDATLHSNARSYVASTFDVAHDHGLTTALYASKTKFVLYKQSYDSGHGAPDKTGEDNGRNKIDVSVINEDALEMMQTLVANMSKKPVNYTFVHIRNADSAGHSAGWGSPIYVDAMKQADGYLGMLFDLVTGDPNLTGKTAIVLTADHGGFGKNHAIKSDPLNYTIPFFVWGAGVAKAADLYKLNASTRLDPGIQRLDYSQSEPQPIRNGDAGNLALWLLGLDPVPDSFINRKQDLATNGDEVARTN